MSTVVILGSRLNIVRAAVDLGVRVLWIRPPGATAQVLPDAVEVRECDLADYPALRSIVLGTDRVAGVFSLTEAGLLATARLNTELVLPTNSPATVRALLDKDLMRQAMAERGLPVVRHRLVTGLADLLDFHAAVGPLILKPAGGTGSQDVFRIGDAESARAAMAAVSRPMIAEELLTGREISVEAFSADGRHYPIGFTDKTFLADGSFIETGHTMPAPVDDPDQVVAAVTDFLDALGVTQGPTHTELMLTPAGPRIIESHTRVGGAGIADLVGLAYGVDLPRLTVGVPLGLVDPPAALPAPIGGAASRAVLPPPGVITDIDVPDLPAQVFAALDCAVGDVIPPLRSGNDKKAGVVIAAGADADAAARAAERAIALVKIVTS